MNYASIKPLDIANGSGVRVSLFVSGCPHRCQGCFNKEAWEESFGQPFTEQTQEHILKLLGKNYISGLTLLGGEPLTPDHQKALWPLIVKVRERFPEKSLWAFTGYVWPDLQPGGRAYCPEVTPKLLSALQVLVDGPFVEKLKDIMLKFRGSSNQRLIDVQKTLQTGEIVLWSSRR
ncbi:anaerobic ribonucleoside-triphosphate reductase activating protein [bacterium]|nr:anaerobic ribonucleoside-triphosphate reductase activating protein [bacterium]